MTQYQTTIWALAVLYAIVSVILIYGILINSGQIFNIGIGLIFFLMLPAAYVFAKARGLI